MVELYRQHVRRESQPAHPGKGRAAHSRLERSPTARPIREQRQCEIHIRQAQAQRAAVQSGKRRKPAPAQGQQVN